MAIDWTNLYKQYRGLWVALKDDEVTVVASADSAKEAWDEARQKGFQQPIITRVPEQLIPFVGSHS